MEQWAINTISRRGALKYLGLLSASVAGREFLASWLPLPVVHGDETTRR